MKLSSLLFSLLLGFVTFPVLAQVAPIDVQPMQGSRYLGDDEDEFEPKEKKEWAVELPAFPQEDDLLPFYVSPIQTQKFYVDAKSISVGEEEVRYTLVGISSGGAKNITYEGLKCDGGFYKRYAVGRYDGTWSKSRGKDWIDVHFRDANRPQASLTLDYFCQGKTVAGTAEEMIDRIRYNRSLMGDRYMTN